MGVRVPPSAPRRIHEPCDTIAGFFVFVLVVHAPEKRPLASFTQVAAILDIRLSFVHFCAAYRRYWRSHRAKSPMSRLALPLAYYSSPQKADAKEAPLSFFAQGWCVPEGGATDGAS